MEISAGPCNTEASPGGGAINPSTILPVSAIRTDGKGGGGSTDLPALSLDQ